MVLADTLSRAMSNPKQNKLDLKDEIFQTDCEVEFEEVNNGKWSCRGTTKPSG